MSEKPAHHRVDVVRIEEILPHPNADKLEIIPIGGFQAIVAKGQFQKGWLGYYIPPDSVVPEAPAYAFLWGNSTVEGGVPRKRRRITAKKLRGEWSEGLLMNCPPTPDGGPHGYGFIQDGKFVRIKEGDDISDLLMIEHYDPEEPTESGPPKPKRPKGWKGYAWDVWRFLTGRGLKTDPVGPKNAVTYDVDNWKKYAKTFEAGELVRVTEKVHGSNARFSYQKGGLWGKGKMFAGSRNLWKAENSKCTWRRALVDNPWILKWCLNNPGYILYGEIVPTQKGYNYGFTDTVGFFLFDIRKPDGTWAEYTEMKELIVTGGCEKTLEDVSVPEIYMGPWGNHVPGMADGTTFTYGKHLLEGVVVRAVPERSVRGLGRAQLKIISNKFLEKEGKA